jgi:methylmalonyl-CoA/ethylmalonyl-CoA epimerase
VLARPERPWRVVRLHHVAFAHQDADTPGLLSGLLGLPCVHEEPAPGFIERMLPAGEAFLQLLQPTDLGTVGRFVDRHGPGLHHVAFEVSDLNEALADLQARGVPMAGEAPRAGGMGTRIAFIHPSACGGLLLELVEAPPADHPRPPDAITPAQPAKPL